METRTPDTSKLPRSTKALIARNKQVPREIAVARDSIMLLLNDSLRNAARDKSESDEIRLATIKAIDLIADEVELVALVGESQKPPKE